VVRIRGSDGTKVPDTRVNLTLSSLLSKPVPAYEDRGKRGETRADGSVEGRLSYRNDDGWDCPEIAPFRAGEAAALDL
jgi:hypothetical protein